MQCGKYCAGRRERIDDMFDEVIGVLEEYTELPKDRMTANSLLLEDLGLNSLDLISIAVVFEDRYDLEIPEEEMENIRSVGDIVSYLENALN